MMITRVIIIITGAWGGGSAKLHNWCLGLRGRSPITTNGDAEDDQDDLGGAHCNDDHGADDTDYHNYEGPFT